MGCSCNSRCIFIATCILQLITVCIRMVFDLMGLQWTAVIANFCQFTVLIFGLYGAYRYKRRVIAVYATWTLIWIGWNVFLICLYLDIGILQLHDHSITVNLAISDSYSWFRNTTFSCDSLSPDSIDVTVTNAPDECLIDFRHIEVFQSGLQIAFACFGFIISCYVIGVLEDDSGSFDFLVDDEKKRRNRPEESPLVRTHVAEE